MKSIFEKKVRDGFIARINLLNENSTAQWGKMNVYQMTKHCVLCDEMYLGKTKYRRNILGFLFGKIALNKLLKNEKPKERNAPTKSNFKNLEITGNLQFEKEKWIALIKEYDAYCQSDFIHWFYGKMTKEQIGYSVYKHIDHHLRQFNV
ncbi:MAG TPA: DUF1569 domain-containing protein [Flavobacterium sp.]|nr:DUF1569 domain-containing protein [Flavobacterium sp.]